MASRRRATVFALLSGALVPLVGCTFVATFDDKGGADASVVSVPDGAPIEDASDDHPIAVHDTGAPDNGDAEADATPPGDSSTTDAAKDSGPADWTFENDNSPPNSNNLTLPGSCNPCAGTENMAAAWYCGSELATSGCSPAAGDLYMCTDGSVGNGSGMALGYVCPGQSVCFHPSGYYAMCNPCPATGTSVCDDLYSNAPPQGSSNVYAQVDCNAGAAAIVGESPTDNTDPSCY